MVPWCRCNESIIKTDPHDAVAPHHLSTTKLSLAHQQPSACVKVEVPLRTLQAG